MQFEPVEARRLLAAEINVGAVRPGPNDLLQQLLDTQSLAGRVTGDENAEITFDYGHSTSTPGGNGLNDVALAGDFGDVGFDQAMTVRQIGGALQWLADTDRDTDQEYLARFGLSQFTPLFADMNGDGFDDLVTVQDTGSRLDWYIHYRDPNGAPLTPGGTVTDYFSDATVETNAAFTFGFPGEVPQVGDFNGDGRADVTTVSGSLWAVRHADAGANPYPVGTTSSGTQQPTDDTLAFAGGGNLPVTGDWDNDGDDDIGLVNVFVTPTRWNLNIDADVDTDITFEYGLPGDQFIVGAWPDSVWDGEGDGTTTGDANNWSNNSLPAAASDVVIDQPQNTTLLVNSNNSLSIGTLATTESINVTNDTLVIGESLASTRDISINAGTLRVDGPVEANSVNLTSGTLQLGTSNPFSGSSTPFTVSSGTIEGVGGARELDSDIAVTSLLVVGGSQQVTLSGVISGTGLLQTLDPIEVLLTAANTYSGLTIVGPSGITLQGDGTLGSTAQSTNVSGTNATLTLGTGIDNEDSVQLSGVLSNIVAVGNAVQSGNVVLNAANQVSLSGLSSSTLNVTGDISGTVTGGGVLQLGSLSPNQTVRLSGNSTYDAGTSVVGTTEVRIESANALPSATQLDLSDDSTVTIEGVAATVGSLSGAANTTVNLGITGSLTVGGDNTSTTFDGTIVGFGQVTKVGTGTLALAGGGSLDNLNVNDGGVRANGDFGVTTVNVESGAKFSGSNDIGFLNVASGGTVSPGSSPGIINSNDFDLQAGSTLEIEIGGDDANPGTDYDQINVTGIVNIDPAATLGTFLLSNLPAGTEQYVIINNDGTDAISGAFAGLPEGATLTIGGSEFTISYLGVDGATGNDVVLTTTESTAFTKFWDAGGDGTSWSDPLNWSGDAVPGAIDRVILDVPATDDIATQNAVTVDSIYSTEKLIFNNNSFTTTSTVDANDFLGGVDLTSATLSVAANTILDGDSTFDDFELDVNTPATFTNQGDLSFQNTGSRIIGDFVNNGNVLHDGFVSLDGGQIVNSINAYYEINGSLDSFSGGERFVNEGLLASFGDTFINVELDNLDFVYVGSDTLTINGVVTQLGFAGTTLTGGFWDVEDGATLDIQSSGLIDTNQGSVFLYGSGEFVQFADLANNQGEFSLSNGAGFGTAGALSNSGFVTVDSTSSLTVFELFTQTDGEVFIDGQLDFISGFSAPSMVIDGGTLSGQGTIDGAGALAVSVDINAGGRINPATSRSPGILTINGTLTYDAAGATTINVGGSIAGTDFDQINVGGPVTLDGGLDIGQISSVVEGQTYTIVNHGVGGSPGQFAGLPEGAPISSVSSPAEFTISYASGNVVLTATNTVFLVTNTNDSGPGSLRQAIIDANAQANSGQPDTIAFDIRPASTHTIAPTSPLPAITDAVVIDGYTQGGAQPNTLNVGSDASLRIALDGGSLTGEDGLVFDGAGASGSELRGLAIQDFEFGVSLLGTSDITIAGNHIGTSLDGSADRGNLRSGVFVNFTSSLNTIGGSTPADRNVLSGNDERGVSIAGDNNVVIGNHIGLNASGTAAVPNSIAGVLAFSGAQGNTIGGIGTGEENVISGNQLHGVSLTQVGTSGNRVIGNLIGLDASGLSAIPNQGNGVSIQEQASGNVIGSNGDGNDDLDEGNVISGNQLSGVGLRADSLTNRILGNSIFDNAGLGIDVGTAGVSGDLPTLTSTTTSGGVTTVEGDLTAAGFNDSTTYRVEFFSSPTADPSGFGEGQTFLGFADVIGQDSFSFSPAAPVVDGDFVTATASANDSTTEFSASVEAVAGGGPTSVTLDSGNLLIRDTASNVDDLLISTNAAATAYVITANNAATLSTDIAGASGNGTSSITVPFSSVTGNSIIVETGDGADSVTIGPTFVPSNAGSDATTAFDVVVDGGAESDVLTWQTSAFLSSIDVTAESILVASDAFALNSQVWNGSVSLPTGDAIFGSESLEFGQDINAETNDLTLNTNSLTLTGDVAGTGNLAISTRGLGQDVVIGAASAGDLSLTTGDIALLQDGFASIRIGNGDTRIATINDVTFSDPLVIDANDIHLDGTLTGADNATITLVDSLGSTTTRMRGDIVTFGNAVIIDDRLEVDSDDPGSIGSLTRTIDTTAAGLFPNGADVTFAEAVDTFDNTAPGTIDFGALFINAGSDGSVVFQDAVGSGPLGLFDDIQIQAASFDFLAGGVVDSLFAEVDSIQLDAIGLPSIGFSLDLNALGDITVTDDSFDFVSNGDFFLTADSDFDGTGDISIIDGATITSEFVSLTGANVSVSDVLATDFNLNIESTSGDVNLGSGDIVALNDETTITAAGSIFQAVGATMPNASGINLDFGDTLIVDGQIESSVSLNSGQTLGGIGTIDNVTVGAGSTVAPGSSPGILNTGDFQLNAGGTLEIELGGTTPGDTPTSHDQVIVTGSVTLGGTLDVSLFGGFAPSPGDVFVIINNDEADAVTETFDGIPEGGTVSDGVFDYRVSYIGIDGNDVVLTAIASGTFVVNNTNDSGAGSLRQAIIDANADPDASLIRFHIPTPGRHRITLSTPLPPITETVTIDGYTDSQASPNTLAVGNNAVIEWEVNGDVMTAGHVFDIQADNVTIRGLSITEVTEEAPINIAGQFAVIEGNFIGLETDGVSIRENTTDIIVQSGASFARIGTDGDGVADAGERNVIAGGGDSVFVAAPTSGTTDTFGTLIAGNYIGTDRSGLLPLGGSGFGVQALQAAKIGGERPLMGNVIADRSSAIFNANRFGGAALDQTAWYSLNGVATDRLSDLVIVGDFGTYVSGKQDFGLSFPINDNVSASLRFPENFDTTEFTMDMWILPDLSSAATGEFLPILRQEDGGGETFGLGLVKHAGGGADLRIGGRISGESEFVLSAGGLIADGLFQHVAVTVRGGDVQLYLDGVAIGGETLSGPFELVGDFADFGSFEIPPLAPQIPRYIGVVDEVGIYDRALEFSEIVGIHALDGNGKSGSIIQGNLIGLGADGDTPLGNSNGISLFETAGVFVGGDSPLAGNVVSDSRDDDSGDGIFTSGTVGTISGITIVGNTIGLNATGDVPRGNINHGIQLADATTDVLIRGNTVSGNEDQGIRVEGSDSTNIVIRDNRIGTDSAGSTPLGNGEGIFVGFEANGVTIDGNVIADNAVDIRIDDADMINIVGNRVGANATGIVALSAFGGPRIEVSEASDLVIGAPGVGNQVVNDDSDGRLLQLGNLSGAILQSNRLGSNADGTAVLGAHQVGLFLDQVDNTTIGTDGDGEVDPLEGNLFAGASSVEVSLQSSDSVTIAGNRIGVDVDGTGILGGALDGVLITNSQSTVIGGPTSSESNLIGGQVDAAIRLIGSSPGPDTDNTRILGNQIGVGAGGLAFGVPTAAGVLVDDGGENVSDTVIGDQGMGNVIGGVQTAVQLSGAAFGTTIRSNFLGITPEDDEIAVGTSIQTSGLGVTIGGLTTPEGNHFGFHTGPAVEIQGGSDVTIVSNRLGITIDGSTVLAGPGDVFNQSAAIEFTGPADNLTVGIDQSLSQAGRNVIAGHGIGISVAPTADLDALVIAANAIGTGLAGITDMGNHGPGIAIDTTLSGEPIRVGIPGFGNVVAFNDGPGVAVTGTSVATSLSPILSNLIRDNAGIAIDVGPSGRTPNDVTDDVQDFPVITTAEAGAMTRVAGSVGLDNFTPPPVGPFQDVLVEFFASSGDGVSGANASRLLGRITLPASATTLPFDVMLPTLTLSGDRITATATFVDNTSELAEPVAAAATVAGLPITDDDLLLLDLDEEFGEFGRRSDVVNEGALVQLQGQFDQLNVNQAHAVTIDWRDGTAPETLVLPVGTRGFSRIHTFIDEGVYEIEVLVGRGDGASGQASFTLTVENVPAMFAAEPTVSFQRDGATVAVPREGDVAVITGEISDPGSGDRHTISVDWGDSAGSVDYLIPAGAAEFTISHVLRDDVDQLTTVTLRDEDSTVDSDSFAFSLVSRNVPPAATIAVPGVIVEGDLLPLVPVVNDLGIDDTFTFQWDVADESGSVFVSNDVTPNFVSVEDGVHTISLWVTDDDRGVATASRRILVQNDTPEITALVVPPAADEGSTITVTGTFTDGGANDVHDVIIEVRNGSGGLVDTIMRRLDRGARNFAIDHRIADDAPSETPSDNYTFVATVVDDDGAASPPVSALSTVNNLPPEVLVFDDGSTDTELKLRAEVTDASVLDTFTFAWDVNGTLLSTSSIDITKPVGQSFRVELTVTDDDTGATSKSIAFLTATPGDDQLTVTVTDNAGSSDVDFNVGGSSGTTTNLTDVDQVIVAALAGADDIVIDQSGDPDIPVIVAAGAGDDTIVADQGDQFVDGGEGTDSIVTGLGNDTVVAIGGDDVVDVGDGDDVVFAVPGSDKDLRDGGGHDRIDFSRVTDDEGNGNGINFDLTLTAGQTQTVDEAGHTITVTGKFEEAVGTNFKDSLTGGAGDNLFGGFSDDTLTGGGGMVEGGDGNDLLFGLDGVDGGTLAGGFDDDTIHGGMGNGGLIDGGDGNDMLFADVGNNVMIQGGTGFDTIHGGGGDGGMVDGGDGNDLIFADLLATNARYEGGLGGDTITGGGGDGEVVDGGEGNDLIFASPLSGNDASYEGGFGGDTIEGAGGGGLDGGDGNDLIFAGIHSSLIRGGRGRDTVVSGGGDAAAEGNSGNDVIIGDPVNGGRLFAGIGDDTVYGGGGDNEIEGGEGNDLIFATFDSGDLPTTVILPPAASGGSSNIDAGFGDDTIFGGDGDNDIEAGEGNDLIFADDAASSNIIDAGFDDDTVHGGGGTNEIEGGDGNDLIFASPMATSNIIDAGFDDDTVFGGGGDNDVRGGDGNDLIFADASANAGSRYDGGVGDDTIYGGSGEETFTGGDGNDLIFAGQFPPDSGAPGGTVGGPGNVIDAGFGDDTVFGGGGDEEIGGGEGNDLIFGDPDGAAGARYDAGPGDDTVRGGGGETEIIGGDGNDLIFGGSLGTAGTRYIAGDGNDTVLGGPGDDTVEGGEGNDLIFGGDAGSDTSHSGVGADMYDAGPGDDTVRGGGGGSDTIIGGDGNDLIFSDGLGTVQAEGGLGDDTFHTAPGVTVIEGDDGFDSVFQEGDVDVVLSDTSITIDGQTASISSIEAVSLQGGPSSNTLDATDFAGDLTLAGGLGDDSLFAGSGDDRLISQGGNDRLVGAAGDDLYAFASEAAGSVVVDEADSLSRDGLDFSALPHAVDIDLTDTAPQPVTPTLTVTLIGDLEDVVGTAFADSITGTSGANKLFGGGGIDLIDGGDAPFGSPDVLSAGATRFVFLDFDSQTDPGEHVYTPAERAAILQRVRDDLDRFDVLVTNDMDVLPTGYDELFGGEFVTVLFNADIAGGLSDRIGFRELGSTGTMLVNVNGFLDPDDGDNTNGLGAVTENFISLSSTIAAHELVHFFGVRHHDAFGNPGQGIYDPTTDASNPLANRFRPVFGGDALAVQTPSHLIASPASIATSLIDAAGNPHLGPRGSLKLAFAEQGVVVIEQDDADKPLVAGQPTQSLGVLPELRVPNFTPGADPDAVFAGSAIVALGEIELDDDRAENDRYSFTISQDAVVTIEVMSSTLRHRINDTFDTFLRLLDSTGNPVTFGTDVASFSDDTIEPTDSLLFDLNLSAGTYVVEVDSFSFLLPELVNNEPNYLGIDVVGFCAANPENAVCVDQDTGSYELLIYTVDADSTPTQTPPADTLIGGVGPDYFVGNSARPKASSFNPFEGDRAFGTLDAPVAFEPLAVDVQIVNDRATGGTGLTVTVNGAVQEVSGQETFGAVIDFGDGTVPQPLPIDADGTFGPLTHTYAAAGEYSVTVSGPLLQTTVAQATTLGTSLTQDGVLHINGRTSIDFVRVAQVGDELQITSLPGEHFVFPIAEVNKIFANLGDGHNQLFADPTLPIPIVYRGGDGVDHVRGGAADDHIETFGKFDRVGARGGQDTIITGDGNDRIYAIGDEAVGDRIDAGDGRDALIFDRAEPAQLGNFDAAASSIERIVAPGVLRGTPGDDVIDLRALDALQVWRIEGLAGNDLILLSDNPGQAVVVDGGEGDDTLIGSSGRDVLHGGPGNDRLEGHEGDDDLWPGIGQDTINAGPGDDRLFAGGEEMIAHQVDLGDGFDQLVNRPNFNGGYEQIVLHQFDVRVSSLEVINAKGQRIVGTEGDDQIDLSTAQLVGVAEIDGRGGNDQIVGSKMTPVPIFGGHGDDTLTGGDGADVLHGQVGSDVLMGLAGPDSLFAGPGSDTVNGGGGNDMLRGDEDADKFVFEDDHGQDVVVDFDPLDGDRLDVRDVAVLSELADPSAVAVQSGGDTVITTGDDDEVRLLDQLMSELGPDDFLF